MALLGCFLGIAFSIVGVMSSEIGLGYADSYHLLGLDGIFSVMGETFGGIDLLFYGIALFQGFKLSFRQLSEEEILEHASVDIERNPRQRLLLQQSKPTLQNLKHQGNPPPKRRTIPHDAHRTDIKRPPLPH